MWIPDHLNGHGDLVPAHYYFLRVLPERWAVTDAYEVEQILSNGPGGINSVVGGAGAAVGVPATGPSQNYGAGQGVKVEENYYDIDGHMKRFFTQGALVELFHGWEIERLRAYTVYHGRKHVLEAICVNAESG